MLNPFTNSLFCTIMRETIVCDVTIVTFSGGTRSHSGVRGTVLKLEDGFRVDYPQDGDHARLTVRGQSLEMTRSGQTQLRMSFEEGRRSELALFLGEDWGSVPIETDRCHIRAVRDGWRIALKYRLLFAHESQVFHVNIAVKFISEEQ